MSPDVSDVSFSLEGQTILAFFLGRRDETEPPPPARALWWEEAAASLDLAFLGLAVGAEVEVDGLPTLLDDEAPIEPLTGGDEMDRVGADDEASLFDREVPLRRMALPLMIRRSEASEDGRWSRRFEVEAPADRRVGFRDELPPFEDRDVEDAGAEFDERFDEGAELDDRWEDGPVALDERREDDAAELDER